MRNVIKMKLTNITTCLFNSCCVNVVVLSVSCYVPTYIGNCTLHRVNAELTGQTVEKIVDIARTTNNATLRTVTVQLAYSGSGSYTTLHNVVFTFSMHQYVY